MRGSIFGSAMCTVAEFPLQGSSCSTSLVRCVSSSSCALGLSEHTWGVNIHSCTHNRQMEAPDHPQFEVTCHATSSHSFADSNLGFPCRPCYITDERRELPRRYCSTSPLQVKTSARVTLPLAPATFKRAHVLAGVEGESQRKNERQIHSEICKILW